MCLRRVGYTVTCRSGPKFARDGSATRRYYSAGHGPAGASLRCSRRVRDPSPPLAAGRGPAGAFLRCSRRVHDPSPPLAAGRGPAGAFLRCSRRVHVPSLLYRRSRTGGSACKPPVVDRREPSLDARDGSATRRYYAAGHGAAGALMSYLCRRSRTGGSACKPPVTERRARFFTAFRMAGGGA